ncbi:MULTISPECIES: hypothetical protein [unclassified Mesorhizobium]|uniref:hypothetical protein n=1 Tax=unclassified Mesorhizobium TaxID=325217 RepID=UPI000FDC0335|nr:MULTISPECIES: hypothetical protein [unclassified Mesorhizobium]TGT64057.1 hypothetical protein EN809_034950 [Mesorhizobium sp. M2E.F.Ca.ET.166.01.1.1]TGV97059.1 hypothetical protein EN797_035210 [Mesorhizobium sp. M2E.F.Ca.ET.154.01.1.1]
MNVLIPFPARSAPTGLGQNGHFKATGVSVQSVHDFVVLENLNTPGRSQVILPRDHNTLRDLANHLHRIADKLP